MTLSEPVAESGASDLGGRIAALEAALAEERRRADALNRIAAAIGCGHDLSSIVQAVVDGGVELCGAKFGAFFYNLVDEQGESYTLYALSGAQRADFEGFPMPRNTAVFHPTFHNEGVVRSDDILADPRYGKSEPYFGMPKGHLPVRSYLAVSVAARSGEVLGGIFFGHPEPGRFTPRTEQLMVGLAAQAAIAIDNFRLSDASVRDMGAASLTRERLQFALEAGRLGSWELDVESRAYESSDQCKSHYGRPPLDHLTFDDLLASVHEGDRTRMQTAMEEAIRTGAAYDIEYRVKHPSGEVRWLHVRGRAAPREETGGVHRMAGVSLDITERKRAEERQRLLLNELNHRVKNTLATVISIASQTTRNSPDLTAFKPAFEARILALSQTHNLLTTENWEAASLDDILVGELTPHAGPRDGGGARFLLDSDRRVRLNPKAAVAIGMVVHELATNAVKYGALSQPEGRVTVRSRVTLLEERDLVIDWIESGGPRVEPPKRRGFGTRVLQQGLAGELGGNVELDYRPEGLSCRIRLPMHALEPTE